MYGVRLYRLVLYFFARMNGLNIAGLSFQNQSILYQISHYLTESVMEYYLYYCPPLAYCIDHLRTSSSFKI